MIAGAAARRTTGTLAPCPASPDRLLKVKLGKAAYPVPLDRLANLLAALSVALHGALGTAGGSRRVGGEPLGQISFANLANLIAAGTSRAVACLRVQVLVDDLTARRAVGALSRTKLGSHQVFVDHRQFGAQIVVVRDDAGHGLQANRFGQS